MAKLTEEELKTIQELNQTFNGLKIQLADAELTKSAILKGIDELRVMYAAEEKKLIEKYGENISINIETGDIEPDEKK